jgi:deoxyribose-phosphate aldolase
MKLVTVCGFPLGYSKSGVKAAEALEALDDGADEIDLVMNVSALRSGMPAWIKSEVARLADLCHSRGAMLKVILETCYLSGEEISRMSVVCRDAGADFIKTSTGFGKGGAAPEHIRLIRAAVGPDCGIKASGGIRTLEFARELLDAGADRIGASGHPSVFLN